MPITDDLERRILAGGLFAMACALAALALALAGLAMDHMLLAGTLCGPTTPHCMACFGAAGCLVAALLAGGSGAWLLRTNGLCGAR